MFHTLAGWSKRGRPSVALQFFRNPCLACSCVLLALAGACTNGSPSKADAKLALQAGLKEFTTIQALAKANPMAGFLMLASGLQIVEVTDLKCERAVGKPGHQCLFEMMMETNDSKKKGEQPRKFTGEGRFVKLDSGWRLVVDVH
jgi:hypothetical protein